ncbi:GNAT family N-acetyltransferase [uncultured Cellulomonas sp.]|uniref:GNAT family N-acetyltransferase n=1 Tax=uncultured Cellulomonas sp. TaxID=189682 RepID=UPI00262662DD|nr:GNAT family N-acetyltransferase [uncultured Cellulomonas sp.]
MRVVDLPAPWSGSPYLLGEHAPADLTAVRSADDALLAVADGPGRGCGLFGIGHPGTLAGLLARAVDEDADALAGAGYATLARGALDQVDDGVRAALGFAAEGSEWDWMWTPQPLTGDGAAAERLPLGPATVDEVAECLSRAHPTASTAPDDQRLIGWWGTRQDGRLMAVVGAVRLAPGLPPHLVSLGVDPVTRGQGLAGAVMTAAVRDCLAVVPDVGPPMVTLGLYASNDVARRLYTRLGLRLEHSFSSRRRPA